MLRAQCKARRDLSVREELPAHGMRLRGGSRNLGNPTTHQQREADGALHGLPAAAGIRRPWGDRIRSGRAGVQDALRLLVKRRRQRADELACQSHRCSEGSENESGAFDAGSERGGPTRRRANDQRASSSAPALAGAGRAGRVLSRGDGVPSTEFMKDST